jgi:histidine triad (HIT) family protein
VYNHAPAGYRCPLCRNVRTGESDRPLEILHRYEQVWVKLNPRWWPANAGGALVFPVDHYENVYDLPHDLGGPLQRAVRDTALAMKGAFACDGVSTRQHNEPAGNQDVWHFHIHVFPRYHGDDLYGSDGTWAPADQMSARADALRSAWPARGEGTT